MSIDLPLMDDVIPLEERDNAAALHRTLHLLDELVEHFSSALELFDTLEVQRVQCQQRIEGREDRRIIPQEELALHKRLRGWQDICVRDGAITLWNIHEARQAMGVGLGRCPTIRDLMDLAALKVANKMFETDFPHVAAVRHAITHCADVFKSADEVNKHALKDAYVAPGVHISAGNFVTVTGRHFQTTWKGEVVGYELGPDSLTKLQSMMETLAAAFKPVEIGLWEKFGELRGAPPGTYTRGR